MRKAIPSSSSTLKKEKTTHTIDVSILPSSSTFTLAGKEPDKLKKKAKNFLDDKQKIKSRAQSLWSFIDATNTFDQTKFFQEHADQVFQVVFETCMHQIGKIKQKSERPQSWNSKELVNLQKTLVLLRKIFLYVPELIRNGWQRQNISILLSFILDHGNHPRLRSLGFQLLLLWLNDQVVEYPECIQLFKNAISLDLFILDDIQPYPSQQPTVPTPMHATTHLHSPYNVSDMEESSHNKLHGLTFVKKLRDNNHPEKPSRPQRDDKIKASTIDFDQTLISHDHPLYPNPVQPTFQDSLLLFHIFISNLVRLAYVAAGSPPPPDEYDYPPGDYFEPDDGIAVGVGIDAATASAKFLFHIFRTYYMTKFVPLILKSTEKGYGFPSCPPSILRLVLKFLIGYCLDHPIQGYRPHPTSFSPATPILKSIVLSSHETREILHEIIRQSLQLPATNYRDVIQGAIHILGSWMLGNEEERPSFLRTIPPSPIEDQEDNSPNQFLRRYVQMIQPVFQHECKDAISLYRALAVSRSGIELDHESWCLILRCLISIEPPEDCADYYWETVFHMFVRADRLWSDLRMPRSGQALDQWVRIMQKLTRLLSSRLYRVEYELYPEQKESKVRVRTRVRSRRLSVQEDAGSIVPEGSVSTLLRNLSSASLSDLANTFKSDRKSTHLPLILNEEEEEEEEVLVEGSGQSVQASIGKKSMATSMGSLDQKDRRLHLDTLWQDSSSKLLSFVHHSDQSTKEDKKLEWDHQSASSIEDISIKSNRTSSSNVWPMNDSISIMANAASVNGRLPPVLGSFKTTEFLILSNLTFDGYQILSIWKNMLLVIGNINKIESPQNYAIAMNCIVEIWDTLRLVRARQPYSDVPIPAMYEIAPWLFQSASLPSEFGIGKALAYGSLCRLMIQKPEEKVPDGYFEAFYKSILTGLGSHDNTIIQSIIVNSERLFSSSLPGVHILIPSFIDAIDKQLLEGNGLSDAPSNVRKSCITILGSLVSISNNLKNVSIQVENMNWINGFEQNKTFSFVNVKRILKDLFVRLVQSGASFITQYDEDTDTYCMLLNAISALALDELMTSEEPQYDLVHECILSIVNHLYCSGIAIINSVADCLDSIAQFYRKELDPNMIVSQEVLSKIIDALTVHLKQYEKNSKCGRGYIISKLFSCLLEWIMSVEPVLLTDSDLCHLVFDVIELALFTTTDVTEKRLPQAPKSTQNEKTYKFKLPIEKRPNIPLDLMNQPNIFDMPENDQEYIRESAEAVLLHLLNHFNNFAPPYGPATMHTTIIGPGVSQDEQRYQQYQYFSFNDTTIIAFEELSKPDENDEQARIIIRDLTGRYAWDTKLEPKPYDSLSKEFSKLDEQEFKLRKNITVRSSNEGHNESNIDENMSKSEYKDPMGDLLKRIGEMHPDCLLDPTLPLNIPSELTSLQTEMVGNLGSALNEYLINEEKNNKEQESDIQLWYDKMKLIRKKAMEKSISKSDESIQTQLIDNFSSGKDFLPAFPQETEISNVPFQQSRLLMSHLGFINYQQLKSGSFQMLNKTPALFRDLRGLDRKHGRETMKIGLIYVGHGQEDESTILQNSQGSERYNAFVNSLGWEIDIATHTGYLGGLEKNLTNGTKATYYCSSTIEMIFHDVTKMPTDISDPKQLKKKRHIGNDHVHIVWNEHDRDYKFDTIGGDFGNAQVVVTPLPDNLYLIQVYRDLKIPYFGPLFDRMIVSQAILGPLVRSSAINAFRASVHTNLHSFYKCVYAQRANDVRTITNRHKVAKWDYGQFMEKIFMPEEH